MNAPGSRGIFPVSLQGIRSSGICGRDFCGEDWFLAKLVGAWFGGGIDEALDWLRTEAGIPWFGVDMETHNLPMEFGLNSAISMTKGCYRGQEIVARVVHRGRLDRRLGAVAIACEEVPERGAEIRVLGTKIGRVTSAIRSPRLGRPLALAVLKIDFLRPGTAVEVLYGEIAHPGEIVPLPLT